MKVLFVAIHFPIPPYQGANVALLETLTSIANLCELHLLVPRTSENSEQDVQKLEQIIPAARLHFYQPRRNERAGLQKYAAAARSAFSGGSYHAAISFDQALREAVRRLANSHRFDIVHCEWLYPAISLQTLNLPLVVRALDLHFLIMNDGLGTLAPTMSRLRKTFWKVEAERFRQFELRVLNNTLVTISVSPEDEAVLRREGASNLVVIPPPMAIPERAKPRLLKDHGCTALFLCSLHVPVNRDACYVFTDEIWPRLSEQVRSQVQVIFAGGVPKEPARRRAAECGIHVQAPLTEEEAQQLYDDCDIFLSPVSAGTGIKTKAMGAMANGKPIIGFRNSFRGIPVENGKHALIADSNDEFARLFERLLADQALRLRLGEAARDFIEEHFNPQTLGLQLIETYAEALGASQQKRATG
jgi:glycosyltransferase involved in cell wall biosynthesis